MGIEGKIKERMEDAVVRSYYKPWYKRWWGRTLFVILFIFIGISLYIGYLTALSRSKIADGLIYNRSLGQWIDQDEFKRNQAELVEIHTGDDPWLGAEEPLVFVVAYESFGCPFCKENQSDIRKLIAKYGDVVRFVPKDFPTEGLHPNVMDAHLAAACANEQGSYWEYHDMLYENQGEFTRDNLTKWARQLGLRENEFSSCLRDEKHIQEIRADFAEGVKAGVVGTPSFIINGNLIPGAIPFELWEDVVAYILQEDFGA